MTHLCIKFEKIHAKRILSGEKITTIRKQSNLKAGDKVTLTEINGEFIADAVIERVYLGFSVDKQGLCLAGYPHDRLQMIIKSEGENWGDILTTLKKYYSLPFFGVVIKFRLAMENNHEHHET